MSVVIPARPDVVPVRPAVLPASAAELAATVRRVAADPRRWHPAVHFEAPRWWTRLEGDERVEIWLLTWLPDATTDLHDHDRSTAAFTVVEGVLDEVTVVPPAQLMTRRLHEGDVRVVLPRRVHDVRAPVVPAVSIHAYSPPLTRMNYYSETPSGLVRVGSVESSEPERHPLQA